MAVNALINAVIGAPLSDPTSPGIEIKVDQAGKLPLLAFKLRHREYRARYWARLRALYQGGESLLGDLDLLREVIPQNNAESDELYMGRLRAAFYANYCSEIVGFVMAGLSEDPLRVVVGDKADKQPDGFLAEFVKDTAGKADDPIDLNTLAREVILEALQVRTAWCLLTGPEDPPDNVLAAMTVAELDAYREEEGKRARLEVRCLPAEQVINWAVDKDGDLEWALTQEMVEVRGNFWAKPVRRYTWRMYTKVDSTTWIADVDPLNPPADTALIGPGEVVAHKWGRVPLIRFTLPHDLWAMDKLESLAREHTDKRNDLGRSAKRSAWPMLYEFLGAEQPGINRQISVHQQDAGRATNTPRSPGHVQRRGREDRAEYVAPPADAYAQILAICHDVRDDMHRVMVQMALAADFKSASAIGRSGESKAQDKAATAVVLGAIGKRFRPWLLKLIRVVIKSTGTEPDTVKPVVQGMAKFDATVVQEVVEQATLLEGVNLPSPTVRQLLAMRVVRALLDNLDPTTVAKIEKELTDGFNPETMLQNQVEAATQLAIANAAGDDPGDDEDEGEEEDDAPPAKGKASGPVVDTAAKGKGRGRR